MFGYATNETEECMPLTVALAHRLNQKMAELRRSGECAWLRPDSKTQVTIEHELRNGEVIPLRVHTVVISVQHSECISLEDQREQLKSKVSKGWKEDNTDATQIVNAVIPAEYLDENTIYWLQPSGKFVIGGPQGKFPIQVTYFNYCLLQQVMPVSLVVKSLSIPTEGGALMAVVLSPARTTQRVKNLQMMSSV